MNESKIEQRKRLNRERARKWRENNREKWNQVGRESKRKYRAKNKELGIQTELEYKRLYQRRNPWVSHYRAAKERCENPNNVSHQYYGRKGIRMILTQLEVELLYKRDHADELEHPSIDRLNSNGDYHFGNCRFIERSENSRRKWNG